MASCIYGLLSHHQCLQIFSPHPSHPAQLEAPSTQLFNHAYINSTLPYRPSLSSDTATAQRQSRHQPSSHSVSKGPTYSLTSPRQAPVKVNPRLSFIHNHASGRRQSILRALQGLHLHVNGAAGRANAL
jgi:hypothetical protein